MTHECKDSAGNEIVPPPSCDCLTDPLLCLLVLVAEAETEVVTGEADLVCVCEGVAAGWEGDGDGEMRGRSFFSEFTDRGRPVLCAWANAMLPVYLPHGIQKDRSSSQSNLDPVNRLPVQNKIKNQECATRASPNQNTSEFPES